MHRIDTPQEISLGADSVLERIQRCYIDPRDRTVFRGQRCASWQLKPTLARFYERLKKANRLGSETRETYAALARSLQKRFRENVLVNQDLPRDIAANDDLWQYGQHHGLPTPLLDWSHSPYVALFFALVDASPMEAEAKPEPRCLWALNLELLGQINQVIKGEIRPRYSDNLDLSVLEEQFPLMEVIDAVDGYNRRLAYQRGCFTKHSHHLSFESWVRHIAEAIPHESSDVPLITKLVFDVSDEQRWSLLRALDKMNVNSRVLYPDIKGSAEDAWLSIEQRIPPSKKSFSWSRNRSP